MSKYEGMIFNDGILFKGKYRLSSDFGMRILDGVPNNHKGIDFVGQDSKDIVSPVDGKVIFSTIITDKSNLTWQWGNYIRIDSNKKRHYFCHLSKRLVIAGQTIEKGQVIGIEGNTGYSFGSHVHFEVRNENNVSIDPKTVFEFGKEKGVDEIVAEIKRYKNIKDTPEFYQEYIKKWVEKGFIKGNTDGTLDFTEDMLRCLIIAERMQNVK